MDVLLTDLTVVETEETRDAATEPLYELPSEQWMKTVPRRFVWALLGGLDEPLEQRLPSPVIDSIAAAGVIAEGMVRLGKMTSKIMTYKQPEPKEVKGYADHFQFEDGDS